MTGVRVVRTGQGIDGRSAILADQPVPEVSLPTGRWLGRAWEDGDAGQAPAFPAPGGARFWTLRVPTDPPGAPPPWHASPTVDLGVVLAGEVVLDTEDGSSTTLPAGTVFVQTGAAHRWRNPHPADALLAVVVLGRAQPEVAE